MLRYSKISILFAIILGFGVFSFSVKAQTPKEIISGIENNITANLTPKYPRAGEEVKIHLESYSTPLDQANITWTENGKQIDKGYGHIDYTTTAGKIGSKTTIRASIITTSGAIVEKVISIQPADIDLLWQASTYTPPFYDGKALFVHQSLITFTAVPSISADKNVSKTAGTYIYKWMKDFDILGDYSGYGKNTFKLRGSIISKPLNLTVQVTTVDGTPIGSAQVTVTPKLPQISFYELNPMLGVLYNHQLKKLNMSGKETSIQAVPYFFNWGSEPYDLRFQWTLNGNIVDTQKDPQVLTLRNTTNESGTASIGLQISNALKVLQYAANTISIDFSSNDNQTTL